MLICTGLHKEQVLTEGREILHRLPRKQDGIAALNRVWGLLLQGQGSQTVPEQTPACGEPGGRVLPAWGDPQQSEGLRPEPGGPTCTLCPRTLSGMQPAHRGPLRSTAPGVNSHRSWGDGCPMATPGTRAGDAAEPQTHRRHLCCFARGARDKRPACCSSPPASQPAHESFNKITGIFEMPGPSTRPLRKLLSKA